MVLSTSSELCLLVAILFGVLGTVSMKLSDGLQKLKPSVCLLIFYSISFAALTLAVQGVDISIVYAIWSGVGTILVAIIGVLLFHESISVTKVISLLLIVIGVLGIHLTDVFH
ncbi:MAG: multidrug efflux SMR transporter [Gammaproteobacteria bacterium]|nr:multidrug efflux SMR transporter [Gammaproteobacteria bacterium]